MASGLVLNNYGQTAIHNRHLADLAGTILSLEPHRTSPALSAGALAN